MKNGTERSFDTLGGAEEGSIDFGQMLIVVREKLWLVVLFTLLGLFGGFAYINQQPRTFLSTTVLEVNTQPMRLVTFDDVHPPSPAVTEMADAIVAAFKSRSFIGYVVELNDLTSNPQFLMSEDQMPVEVTKESAVNALLAMQRVQPRRGTPFIDVSVMHTDPKMAQKLADMLAEGFIRQSIKRRAGASEMAMQFLLGEATKLKEQLQKSEEALQEYVEKSNAISLEEKEDIVVTRLKSISTQLIEAKAARMRLESDEEKVRQFTGKPEELIKVASVAELGAVTAAQGKISEIETAIATLALRYTDKHPKMIAMKLQLSEAEASLREILMNVPPLIRSNYESAMDMEKKFEAALKDQEKVAMDLNKQAIPYKVLSREVETNRALYESILRRLKESEIAKGIELNSVSVFEPAMLASAPMQPKKSRTLGIAVAIGLGTGLLLSFGLAALDSSIRTVDQAQRVTGLNVVGAIPREPTDDMAGRALALHRNPASPVAEAFRSLRASLHVAARFGRHQVVLFTSAEPGEGKTFCAINYAVAAAQQGLRTVIIDADLRVSTIGRVLLPDRNVPGLTDFLVGSYGSGECIHETEVANLSVAPAGSLAPNPAELLSGPRFADLMQVLRTNFDRVVIDTVPVLAVSDAMLILEHADLVCFVVRAGKTSRKNVVRAKTLLADAGAKLAGVLLNQLKIRTGNEYNRYIGKYGNSRPYGRGADAEKPAELQPTPRDVAT